MKKRIVCLSFLVWFTLLASSVAQLNIGVMGGINMANLNAEQATTREWTWGAGATIEYYFTKRIALHIEPMLMNKGGVMDGTGSNPRITIDLDVIDIPLMLKYDFIVPEDMYVIAGPTIGILSSSDLGIEINNQIFDADVKDNLENIEIGAAVGVGINVPLPIGKILLETKYSLGFTNMAKDGKFEAKRGDLTIEGYFDEKESRFNTYGVQFMLAYLVEI